MAVLERAQAQNLAGPLLAGAPGCRLHVLCLEFGQF